MLPKPEKAGVNYNVRQVVKSITSLVLNASPIYLAKLICFVFSAVVTLNRLFISYSQRT